MQVYNSFGPNPRALRMFLAEKGLTLPQQDVDLMGEENRKAAYTERNPRGLLLLLATTTMMSNQPDTSKLLGRHVPPVQFS